jgi:peptidoglycan/xylan/chitin deacetylase (PgdA/CDA1 family)
LLITFDDAFLSVFTLAAPLLEQLGAVATVYAPTVPIAEQTPLQWPEVAHHLRTEHAFEMRPMSVAQLGELAARGWEIGSHTRTHPWLPSVLDDDVLARELAGSKGELEALLERPVHTLAYPFGAHDRRVAKAAAAAGYAAAVTLPPAGAVRWPSSPSEEERMMLPRIGVYHRDDKWRFRMKTSPLVRVVRATGGGRRRRPNG